MIKTLTAFEDVSGLAANDDKTTIYFGNVQDDIQE